MPVNLVLKNGVIHTFDENIPRSTAIAIAGNRIIAVGSDEQMQARLGPGSLVIDLEGRCVVPGLVDAHVHFRSMALQMKRVELSETENLDQALKLISQDQSNQKEESWILGRGWNQANWSEWNFPSKVELDQVTGYRPAFLRHQSGHAAWTNSKALQLAGINSSTPDPSGGKIERYPSGEPTGILFEEAIELVRLMVPKPSESEIVESMRLAQIRCLEVGLTGIHDFDGRSCFQALQALHRQEELMLRVVKNIPVTRLDYAIGLGIRTGFGDDWLRIGGVKMFADGALGPRTASMIEPYEHEPDNRGIVVTEKEEMIAMATQASKAGLSMTVHAIGDRANHDVLDVLETVRDYEMTNSAQPAPPPALRHRIEHAQILHPDDIERFEKLDIIASMQPIHATSDMDMANRYWGERVKMAYAWRSLVQAGAVLAFGSDAPVDSVEPLNGIHAAVTRRQPDGYPGPKGWTSHQRISLRQAIQAYTMGPAFTSGRERKMGSITPGKLADLTILDRDVFGIPDDELVDIRIAGTMVDGRMRYQTW